MRRSYCPTKLALLIFFLLLGGLNFLPTQLATATQTGVPANSREEFFEQKIRPLLAAHCYGCHTATESGGLRLDSRAALLKGGASGTAIVPGNPDGSLLIQAVSHTHST
ncbi:MAG TPA: hypothetical protein PLD20_16400, partial [Blastocatellia bacterium]|nr:hypothetical protein [Blastocatellia bacterium]